MKTHSCHVLSRTKAFSEEQIKWIFTDNLPNLFCPYSTFILGHCTISWYNMLLPCLIIVFVVICLFFLVMATLQLPANNLANLANLPPGTKLYLTTNSKNPSGKGKLLLIPQGAILRASQSAGQTQMSNEFGNIVIVYFCIQINI